MGVISQANVKGTLFDIRDRITEEMACAEYPTREIAGDLIHLTDAADIPVKNLSITLTPVQSGTGDPSPTNIRPISGTDGVVVTRTGKNLYPVSIGEDGFTNNGGGTHSNDNGVLVVTGTASGTSSGVYSASGSGCSDIVGTLAGKTVTYSFDAKADTTLVARIGYARNGRVNASLTTSWQRFTSTVVFGEEADAFTVYTGGTAATIQVRNLQIEFGSTATDYEPYQGDTYSVSLPQTVYSGVVDVTGGTVTVTQKLVSMKLSDATKREETANTNRYTLVNVFDSIGEVIDKTDGSGKTICNMLSTYAYNTADTPHFYVVDRNALLFLPKDIDETMTAQVLATLATPQVISLTPTEITTLLNENYIWASAGNLSLVYRQKFDVRLTEAIAKMLPTETVIGDIVSISDGAEDIPVKALSVAVEPVQAGSGDPSPDNVRAITGWDAVNVVMCGVNIWDGKTERGMIAANGNNYSNDSASRTVGYIPVVEGATYYCKSTVLDVVNARFYDADKNHMSNTSIANIAFTVPTGARYLRFYCNEYPYTNGISINYPSTDHDLHEPSPIATYPIPLPFTVYGGTLDVATGVLTVDMAMVTADAFSTYGSGLSSGGLHWCDTPPIATQSGTALSNMFVRKDGNSGWASGIPCFAINTNGNVRVYNSCESLTDFKATYSDLQVVYPLATPQTVQLTPTEVRTLLGDNVVFSDAGQVTVAYRADVGLYIDKRIAEVQALVLDNE